MLYTITGGAGFIGSNIAEEIVRRGKRVRILDNFSTGKRENLSFPGSERIEVIEGDVQGLADCRKAAEGADFILHHAALVSVSRSVADPILCHDINVTGTLNMLVAARDAGAKRFVFASSAAVYGNRDSGSALPESVRLEPMSPYGSSKLIGEINCALFRELYGLETVALRYFNVYGKRQNPHSDYAAVIPKFIQALLEGKRPTVYGDGLQSRDFICVSDVVNANIKACEADGRAAGLAFNIACNRSHSLLDLLREISAITKKNGNPLFTDPQPGDIRFSMADISLAREFLGFNPETSFHSGLEQTVEWYRGKIEIEKLRR
ncbi:MAG TPA: SDR family oxidoreductase [Syntrophales bacterium]|nr:SDR family oxidoreductase [Syntrophales bacterium]